MTRKMTINVARAQRGNVLFPAWECFVSSVGINNSPKAHFLRSLLLLLVMLAFGTTVSWADGYEGFYYIANYTRDNSKAKGYVENDPAGNYYLCPAAVYYNDNPEMPHLTTKRTNRGANSIWELRKVPNTNFYHIIHYEEGGNGKYLVHNTTPSSLSELNKPNRFRVHLEANPTLENNNDVLFIVTQNSGSDKWFSICPEADSNNPKRSLNPANGNKDSYAPLGTEKNGNKTFATPGIIGIYGTGNNDGEASRWYLEEAAPIIRYNSESTIKITYPVSGASIYYSFGEDSTPSEGVNSYSGAINLPTGTTTIKAIAIKDGKQSGIATYTPPFLLGSTHKYIIQSENCQFYRLIPNVSVDDNTKYLSTLNVPCSTMAWHFEYAEDFYYYIVDENGWYMYYTANDDKYIYLKSSKDNDDDGFKFNIEFHANGGYNIMPKGQGKSIYKTNYGGSNDAGLKPVMYDGTITEDIARWNLIPYSTTNLPMWETSPFAESTDNVTNYYNVVSVSQTTKPLILNNDGDIKSQTLPELNYDSRKSMWVIKKVEDENSELLDYYTFQNAFTGELLYYNGNGRNYVNAVLQLGQPTTEGADATWSHFVIVQTANNGYNIIPRPIVDNTKAINRNTTTNEGFNCINRRGGDDVLGTFFDDGEGSRWTFSRVTDAVPCINPVFEETVTETGKTITLSCNTNASEIYFTDNGTDPTASGTKYANQTWSSTEKHLIKAYAKLKNDATDGSNSDVVTLLNKPNITVEEITYNGTAQEPNITKVSIGETGSETEAPSTAYSASYSGDNINAGTDAATVTLSDADATDLWCIWNAATTFSIGKAPLTITPTADLSKVYGEDDPTLTYSSSIATTSGLYGTDAFDGALGRVDGENVGSYPINQGTLKVTRESTDVSANYDITIADESFAITERAITISGITASEKTYDGNTTATLVYTDVTYGNIKDGDVLTVTATGSFDSKNAGTSKTVTISGLTLGGTDAANYTLPASGQQDEATADINPKPLTINVAFTANSKTYDGTTAADFGSIDISLATIEGLIEGDDLMIVSATGTFDDKNVGTGKTVTITGFTFGGADAANYTYNGGDLTTTADITPAEVTVKADDKTKGYGDADPEFTATVTGLQNGEDASVITFTTVSRESGESVGNYTITMTGNTSQGNYKVTEYTTGQLTITAKSLGDGTVPAPGITIDVSKAGETYSVTVKQNENTLVQGEAYTWSGADSDNNYVVTVTGKGNYTGSAQAKFINLNFYGTNQGEGTSTEGQTETAAAYCAAEDLQATGGVKAYTVTAVDVENNIVYITEIKAGEVNYIPHDVPVLLLGDANTEGFTLKPYNGTTVTIGEENLLKQSDGSIAVTTPDYYIFYEGAFVLSMWGTDKTMKSGKFYVHPTESSSSPAPAYAGLRLVKGGTTMVDAIVDNSDLSNQQHPEEWYTLDGQKLNKKPSRKGLYILNGQKVVIK